MSNAGAFLRSGLRRLNRLFGRVEKYELAGLEIELSSGHLLPHYQKLFRTYDQFLPLLAKRLPVGSSVIDIGANVGDTLVSLAMVAPTLRYHCVEADESFFRLLERNAARLVQERPAVSVRLHRSLVGSGHIGGVLIGSGGTKRVIADGLVQSVATTLDDLLLDELDAGVSLIKCDVDGFDFDVVASGEQIIRDNLPIVFFEADPYDDRQWQGYCSLLNRLAGFGYANWVVFDNFGRFLCETNEVGLVEQLIGYCYGQRSSSERRSIYYVDIMVFDSKAAPIVALALEAFRSRH